MMKHEVNLYFLYPWLLVIFLISATPRFVNAQDLFDNHELLDSLKNGIHATYNFNFERADQIAVLVDLSYSDHPTVLMYKAIILYWKYYPLQIDTEQGDRYESLLQQSLSQSKALYNDASESELTKFFGMLPRMMLLQYYADNGLELRAIPYISRAYRSIVDGFTDCKTFPDFYFTTGLYDYYREAYPEANPFYKPFVSFFPDGNKQRGLNELYACWQNAEYIGPEALSFLTYIYINFETDYSYGLKYALELTEEFPNNPLYAQYYVQLLLLNRQYCNAEFVVTKVLADEKVNLFFQNVFAIDKAIVFEHYYSNYSKAESIYSRIISSISPYGHFARKYISYAYFGLSRINALEGLKKQSVYCKTRAKKFAQYPQVNFD